MAFLSVVDARTLYNRHCGRSRASHRERLSSPTDAAGRPAGCGSGLVAPSSAAKRVSRLVLSRPRACSALCVCCRTAALP